MKHAQATGSGRVYDEKTHQWVDAGEAPAKATRRARAKPEPASSAQTSAAEDNPQSAEE